MPENSLEWASVRSYHVQGGRRWKESKVKNEVADNGSRQIRVYMTGSPMEGSAMLHPRFEEGEEKWKKEN